jgi:hypothetical protein
MNQLPGYDPLPAEIFFNRLTFDESAALDAHSKMTSNTVNGFLNFCQKTTAIKLKRVNESA